MDNDIGFSHAFGLCQTNLKIVGLWPKSEKTASLIIFVLSLSIIILFVNAAQTTRLIMIWGDLYEMTDNLSAANLPIAAMVLKMFIFRSHRKVLDTLLTLVMNDWNSHKQIHELKIMENNAKLSRKITVICLGLGSCSVCSCLFVRILQELNILPSGEKRRPMLSSYFPYDYKPSPIYELTWLSQFCGSALATFAYSGVYCFFVGLMLHLRGQVTNLRICLEKIVTYDRNGVRLSSSEFKEKIKFIVRRHESLNRFAENIENVFKFIFLIKLVMCTVQICIQGFLLVIIIANADKGALLFHILFLIVFLSHIGTHVFICCYVADKLRVESMAMSTSAYNSEWYNLRTQDVKFLIMVMHRADKPLEVTAGKFCAFSLRLYAQILKTSGGYLSMLLAVRDRVPNN